MNISKKRLILIIIGSYIGLNIIISSIWFLAGNKINMTSEPNYDKVLTKQEIKKVIDDTLVDLGNTVAQYDHSDDGEFNEYEASFTIDSLDVKLFLGDMTGFTAETHKMITNDSDVIWEDYVKKAYYNMVKTYAESAYQDFIYYEDFASLTKIMDYDVEISSFSPEGDHYQYTERAKTVIGNYMIYIEVSHENEALVINASESILKMFMENLIESL